MGMEDQSFAHRLGPKVKMITNTFRRIANSSTAELGITGAQSFLLGYLALHRSEPPCQHDIEVLFNIKHPTATGILRRLAEKRFVEFKSDSYDKRLKRIVITDAGAEAAALTKTRLDELDEKLTYNFLPEELAELHRLLDKLVANACEQSRHPILEGEDEEE